MMLEDYKGDSRREIQTNRKLNSQRQRRNMKTSTKDKLKGSFHEVKGTIKEEVGKATHDRELKAEGRVETKETVAKLRGKLADLTPK